MNFGYLLREGRIKQIAPNKIRAASLFKSSAQAIETAKIITLNTTTAKTVFRELYEGLREYCEAVGLLRGYKFLDHESITYFLRDFLKDEFAGNKFDRYRKLRNGINYYGDDLELETVNEALIDIPELVKALEKYK